MVYTNIEDIPYPFLHDACLMMDKYTEGFKSLYIDPKGRCSISLKGMIEDIPTLQRIMGDLDPDVTSESCLSDYEPKICIDYDWSKNETETYIYSKDKIDYREL